MHVWFHTTGELPGWRSTSVNALRTSELSHPSLPDTQEGTEPTGKTSVIKEQQHGHQHRVTTNLGTLGTWVWWPGWTKALTFARPGLKERPCLPTWVAIPPSFLYRDRLANRSVLQLFWRMSSKWLSLHQLLMLSNQRRYCDSYRFSHMTSHSLREDKQTSCMFCNICFRGFSGKMFEAVSKLDWCIVWTFSQNNRDTPTPMHLLYIRRCVPLPRGTALATEPGILSPQPFVFEPSKGSLNVRAHLFLRREHVIQNTVSQLANVQNPQSTAKVQKAFPVQLHSWLMCNT